MTFVVSNATAGSQTLWGTASVVNVAQGAFEQGWESMRVGMLRVHDGRNGADVQLDLTGSYAPAFALRFTFAGDEPISLATLGAQTRIGTATFANAAFEARPSGGSQTIWGRTLVARVAPLVTFDLTGTYAAPPATNTPFYFGGTIVMVARGFVATAFGNITFGSALSAHDAGNIDALTVGVQRVHRGQNGANVVLDLTETYTPTIGDAQMAFGWQLPIPRVGGDGYAMIGTPTIANVTPQLFPEGIASSAFGTPIVMLATYEFANLDFRNDYTPPTALNVPFDFDVIGLLEPSGFNATAFGTAAFRTADQIIPTGWSSLFVGVLTARGGTVTINLSSNGIASSNAFGSHRIEYLERRIRHITLNVASLFGTTVVTPQHRTLDVHNRGIPPGDFGAHLVAYKDRELAPLPFLATLYGTPMVDRDHDVTFTGTDFLVMGDAEVHYPRQTIAISQPYSGLAFGDAFFDLGTKAAYPVGFRSIVNDERYGRPEVRLNTRYIEQLFEVTTSDGGQFGSFNLVENRNKTIPVITGTHTTYGTPTIVLAGRFLTNCGALDATIYGDTLVAHYIRSVYPSGYDASIFHSWNAVANAARVLAPFGVDTSSFGAHAAENNRRFYTTIGHDSQVFGQAMIADAIRTLVVYAMSDQPNIPHPVVELKTRYIPAGGYSFGGIGVPTVVERFTIFRPMAITSSNRFGEHRVRNVTPQVYPGGYLQTEWGGTHIFNQHETYALQGYIATLFGGHVVRDRTFRPSVFGWDSATFGLHRVYRDGPILPDPQVVTFVGFDISAVGTHVVRANSIYPAGFIATLVAQPTVARNGIIPDGIRPPYSSITGSQFGLPSLAPTQYARHHHGPDEGDMSLWGKPRLSPHTIWCAPAPQQARENHPEGPPWHRIDEYSGAPPKPFIGHPIVGNYYRSIATAGSSSMVVGDATFVSLRVRTLAAVGTRFQRFGIPQMYGGIGQLQTYGSDSMAMGEPTLLIPEPLNRALAVRTLNATLWGSTLVQLRNQPMYPFGFVATRVGTVLDPGSNNTTNLGHIVAHEYAPFAIDGFNATIWGLTFVSHRIRTVFPEGNDHALVAEYEPLYFRDRMRVRRRDHIFVPSMGVTSQLGAPTLGLRERTILASGFTAWRIGPVTLRGSSAVSCSGWESLLMGELQQWEAGKVKPHGDEMQGFGHARIAQTVSPSGFEGSLGTASVGRVVKPDGFDTLAVEVPVAIGFHCTHRARAMPGFEATVFGTAGVSG